MDIKYVLRSCAVEGNIVKLPPVQLDRKLYLEVKKSLELIGGKWKGSKIQGFVFDSDPTGLLLKIAEGEAYNLKKDFQFFETPDDIADRLVALAGIKPTDRVLEPSVGRGAIVRAIHRKFPDIVVDGYELMDINVSFLDKLPNFRLTGRDFLSECSDKYHVIIANPPFSKNQDINHIIKMDSLLYPDGRLVTIAGTHWQFAQAKMEGMFRQWLEKRGAEVYPIERGGFKESGTMVETCIIKIVK